MVLGKRPFDKIDTNDRKNDENKENCSPDQSPAKKRHILPNSESKKLTGQTKESKLQETLYALENKAALQKTKNKFDMQTEELQRIGILPSNGRDMPDIRAYPLTYGSGSDHRTEPEPEPALTTEQALTDEQKLNWATDKLYFNYCEWKHSNNPTDSYLNQLLDGVSSLNTYGEVITLNSLLGTIWSERNNTDNIDRDVEVHRHLQNLIGYTTDTSIPPGERNHIREFLQKLELMNAFPQEPAT